MVVAGWLLLGLSFVCACLRGLVEKIDPPALGAEAAYAHAQLQHLEMAVIGLLLLRIELL